MRRMTNLIWIVVDYTTRTAPLKWILAPVLWIAVAVMQTLLEEEEE